MPKVSEEQLAARQQQIMDAAIACFIRKGFHQTTMQDICAEAELSPGAVYRYFKSKEDIIAAACAEGRQVTAAQFDEIDRAASGQEAFDAALETFFPRVQGERMPFDLEIWAEAIRNPRVRETVVQNQEAVLDRVEAMVRRGQAEGLFPADLDARDAARALFSLFLGLQVQRALAGGAVDVDRYMDAVRGLLPAIEPRPAPAGAVR